MAYLGIGYCGKKDDFLKLMVDEHELWLKGDRPPKFYGSCFCLLYDSNVAREFAKKCKIAAPENKLTVFAIEKLID